MSNDGSNGWKVTKEKLLLWGGFVALGFYIGSFLFANKVFPIEYLLLVGGMFGLSLAAWGDKK